MVNLNSILNWNFKFHNFTIHTNFRLSIELRSRLKVYLIGASSLDNSIEMNPPSPEGSLKSSCSTMRVQMREDST